MCKIRLFPPPSSPQRTALLFNSENAVYHHLWSCRAQHYHRLSGWTNSSAALGFKTFPLNNRENKSCIIFVAMQPPNSKSWWYSNKTMRSPVSTMLTGEIVDHPSSCCCNLSVWHWWTAMCIMLRNIRPKTDPQSKNWQHRQAKQCVVYSSANISYINH